MVAQLISGDERNDFLAGVKALGYNLREFVVAGTRSDTPIGGGVHAVRQEVYIERISNGIFGTYRASHRYAWIREALADLERGVFGPK